MRTPYCIAVLAGTTLLLTACEEPATTPPPPPPAEVHLLTEHQWAGGDILISSDDFLGMVVYKAVDDSGNVIEGRWANLLVIFGDDTLPTRGFDGTTIAATLPRTTNGSRSVSVVMDTRTEELGDVRAYGFARMLDGPMVSGYAPRFPRDGSNPQVLAQGTDALLLVDLRDMSTQQVVAYSDLPDDPRDYQVGPGWSHRADAAVILHQLWQLLPIGAAQPLGEESPYQSRFVAHLAPGKWFGASNHYTWFCCPNHSLRDDNFLEDVAVSPRGDRMTPIGFGAYRIDPGVPGDQSPYTYAWPVFDGEGELLYAVGRRPSSMWMDFYTAFSHTGDTLYVGMPNLARDGGELQAVRADDGAVLGSVQLDYWPQYVAVDSVRPWIYLPSLVLKGEGNWILAVIVVDRSTMEVVGTPTAPDETTLWGGTDPVDLVRTIIDGEAMYLTSQWSNVSTVLYTLHSWQFDLLPPGLEPSIP